MWWIAPHPSTDETSLSSISYLMHPGTTSAGSSDCPAITSPAAISAAASQSTARPSTRATSTREPAVADPVQYHRAHGQALADGRSPQHRLRFPNPRPAGRSARRPGVSDLASRACDLSPDAEHVSIRWLRCLHGSQVSVTLPQEDLVTDPLTRLAETGDPTRPEQQPPTVSAGKRDGAELRRPQRGTSWCS